MCEIYIYLWAGDNRESEDTQLVMTVGLRILRGRNYLVDALPILSQRSLLWMVSQAFSENT